MLKSSVAFAAVVSIAVIGLCERPLQLVPVAVHAVLCSLLCSARLDDSAPDANPFVVQIPATPYPSSLT